MRISAFYLSVILIWPSVWRQNPKVSAADTACREFAFDGRVRGGEEYSRKLGAGLFFRLNPLGMSPSEKSGWSIEVQPQGGKDDYAWPVNPPFHFGNSQWLATGYGEPVKVQLSNEHEVFFVLDETEYERASKAAENALYGGNPDAATKFLTTLPSLRSAVLTLKPLKYETTDEGKSVSWMQFTVTVIAPSTFQIATGLVTKNVACPQSIATFR